MTTAADIIRGALRRLQVNGSETPIEDDEIADGLEDLNDWANQLESSTLPLGFIPAVVPADDINIPKQAVGMYKDNLAIYMAGQYGAPLAQSLIKSASDSMNAALIMFQKTISVQYPDTLPVGTGNHCDSVFDEKFFTVNEPENF